MRKLAIVGSGPETRDLAPFEDQDYTIWVFNEAATSKWCKRWDAVFQMHSPELYKAHNTKDPKHWEWLQEKHGKPIYMQKVDPLVPDSVEFPLDEVTALTGFRYFTGTPAMAIALGSSRFDHIEIFGVELSVTEYEYQAECIRFWVGFAKGKLGSDNVVLHQLSHMSKSLFDAPLYGYEGGFAFGKEYFDERVKELDQQWHEKERLVQRQKDKLEDTVREMKFDKVPDLAKQYQSLATECGELAGALSESERYAGFGERYADRGGFENAAALAQREAEVKKWEMVMTSGKTEYVYAAWVQSKKNDATNYLLQYLALLGKQAYDFGAHMGKYRENIIYVKRYDAMELANGVVYAAHRNQPT